MAYGCSLCRCGYLFWALCYLERHVEHSFDEWFSMNTAAIVSLQIIGSLFSPIDPAACMLEFLVHTKFSFYSLF